MEKIYSRVEPTVLLHIIHRRNDFEVKREDVVPGTEFLQMAALNMDAGQTFKPHRHIWKMRTEEKIAQESWVVIRGAVKCILYDLDDKIIAEPVLQTGDCSITLRGGHNYIALENHTYVREFKTGPYEGQELDKRFI